MKNKVFKIPVEWAMYGTVEVEARDISEAIEIFKKKESGELEGEFSLPEGNYIDGSFKLSGDEDELVDLINLIN